MATQWITAELFDAGQQCAKRLHLAVANVRPHIPVDRDRDHMIAVGDEVRQLARTAFPQPTTIEDPGTPAAAEATARALADSEVRTIFNATFEHDAARVVCDVLLRGADGRLDLFEIKAGNSVKPRYLHQLALQVYVIEGAAESAGGHRVGRCEILHLDPRYRAPDDAPHQVHKLFRNVDVTHRVRQRVAAIPDQLARLRAMATDKSALDTPTGQWCERPFPCPYYSTCRAAEPDVPLRHLPDLSPSAERALLARGIHDVRDLDPVASSWSPRQRLAIRSARRGTVETEDFVATELASLGQPIHAVAALYALDVIPALPGARPWQFIPYAWSVHTRHVDDQVEHRAWVAPAGTDPRVAFARSLRERIDGPGTLVMFSSEHERRWRRLVEALDEGKGDLRAVLHCPRLALDSLLSAGVALPKLGRQPNVLEAAHCLAGASDGSSKPPAAAWAAAECADHWRKASAPRTRTATRDKLHAQLRDQVSTLSAATLQVFAALARS